MALSEQQKDVLRHPVKWFKTHGEDEIPRKELSSMLFGTMGQVVMFGMAGNWFFHFCTNVLKIDPRAVGQMTGAVAAFDAMVDPVAGTVIDSHQFKDGRKLVPWIRNLAPPCALLSFLLFVNWNFQNTALKIAYCVAIYLIWDTLHSFLNTSLMGMTAAISPFSSQRARTAQWMDIGQMIGFFMPELLMPMLSDGGAFGMTQQRVYLIFAVILCLGGGFLMLSATGLKERVTAIQGSRSNPFKMIFNVLRHNHILLLLLLMDLIRCASPNINMIYVFQQVNYQWGGRVISGAALVTILTVLAGLPGAALKLVAVKVADKMGGMKRVMIIATLTDVACRVITFFIGYNTMTKIILVYVFETIVQIPWNLYGIAQRALLGDSVDFVEWKTGQRTEGITMSARNLSMKLGGGLRRFIMGYTLDWLQYDASLVELKLPQNAHFQRNVWGVFKLGIGAGAFLSLIPLVLMKYPDTLKAQVESELAERRAMAEGKESAEV